MFSLYFLIYYYRLFIFFSDYFLSYYSKESALSFCFFIYYYNCFFNYPQILYNYCIFPFFIFNSYQISIFFFIRILYFSFCSLTQSFIAFSWFFLSLSSLFVTFSKPLLKLSILLLKFSTYVSYYRNFLLAQVVDFDYLSSMFLLYF